MKKYKNLKIEGAILNEKQLEEYLKKISLQHNIGKKSDKLTYPIPQLLENYNIIKIVYNLLNEHIKLGITINPAGEWILDNFYIIEEVIQQIEKELTMKKYVNFVGIQNGQYAGFARIHVLASEIVAYTDNIIRSESLEKYLTSYQNKRALNMDEIWNIGIFLQIAIIQNITDICIKIYNSQVQKYKVKNIIERLVEKKDRNKLEFKPISMNKLEKQDFQDINYSFIEYMSYCLKKYGKKAYGYLKILEEETEKAGITVQDAIQKEHFDIAICKTSMANCIISMKKIQRINFLEIFEKINGVEEILNRDPTNIYNKMEYKTKELYRNNIKELAKQSNISEIYISRKILELCQRPNLKEKQKHIGYYLIDDGRKELCYELGINEKKLSYNVKTQIYILAIIIFTISISVFLSKTVVKDNLIKTIITILLLILPVSEFVVQTINRILSKYVKNKIIPKMDFFEGIDSENSTFVVIPTIIKSKERVRELFRKLEVFYLANKSKNIYFALLGDCSESDKKEEKFDKEVIDEGLLQVQLLNDKYHKDTEFPIFHFLYREREFNNSEEKYLGWERKRGLLIQFNEYILKHSKNKFKINTINQDILPKIKYVITLDADTELPLNTAFELVGAMAHILNKPELDVNKNIVKKGHALLQPRVGVNLNDSNKNVFTKIFAGAGGIDNYTNAISDVYQDNFDEGIFTGKGIYDLEIFSKVLTNAIPENTVLSHDLLEGCYLRCGLASDIIFLDGYPAKYLSFMNRLSRWIRGDWQIKKWLKSKLNTLSKFKILDNLRRSLIEISVIILLIWNLLFLNKNKTLSLISLGIIIYPFILEFFSKIFSIREGEKKQKTFNPQIDGIKGTIYRAIITLGCLPYKAYVSSKAIFKTLYRLMISHKNMLEWTTSEEAEKQTKTDLKTYYDTMFVNVIFGIITIYVSCLYFNLFTLILGLLWIITPYIMCKISEINEEKQIEINEDDKKYLKDIAQKTWQFFKDYITEENNYLMPDNYQEDRRNIVVNRTSSTNIGLSLLAVIASYDMGFEKNEDIINLLEKIINTVYELPKWNGHLFNWYNVKTKKPLYPKYVSTVDSGNLIGYLYTTKSFLEENIEFDKEKISNMIEKINYIIEQTNFKVLYNNEQRVFSIGFNVEENKLTDSYYDLLASEARQASFVAIAKKDISPKHWGNLSRTLTVLKKYKGLVSWSGTAFEYLMPNINIKRYKGSLLDESSKFAIMNQIEYSQKVGIPWGMSEAAFNLKDLQGNYQYKAFGIPWLGLKRGLEDDIVISSYGTILAISDVPNEVVQNLKILEKEGMKGKYGFYESIDYTPERLEKGKKSEPVKTYMAHHQALILLSLNNYFNNQIFQKRFSQNAEIEAVNILLQERMPETFIITKENKQKPEKIKYKDYENYSVRQYNKIDNRIIRGNLIGNEKYTIAINQNGEGVSKFGDNYINRYKRTADYPQGIFICVKDVKNNEIEYMTGNKNCNKYVINFAPDKSQFEKEKNQLKSRLSIITDANEPVEIRRVELENLSQEEKILEVVCYFEPVLSRKEQDYAHQAFNNLFLEYEYDDVNDTMVVKRRKRGKNEQNLYLIAKLQTDIEKIGETEYEISKEKFIGRNNLDIPEAIRNSIPLSKKIRLTTEGIVALKNTIKILPESKGYIDFLMSVEYEKEMAEKNINKYSITENITKEFEIVRAKTDAELRYLEMKGRNIDIYQTIASYIIFDTPFHKKIKNKSCQYNQCDLWKYGISGDLPIITITIKYLNDVYVIKEVLKMYEYLRTKNLKTELVIIDEEKYSYENYLKNEIENAIQNSQLAYLKNIFGGIFTLSRAEMNQQDLEMIKFISIFVIDAHLGNLENIIKDKETEIIDNYKIVEQNMIFENIEDDSNEIDLLANTDELKYYNGYGAFSKDGKEYIIKINKNQKTPTTWSHIIANEKFGTCVTESNGGYTWYKNSRLNRVSSWDNSIIINIPSEIIYLQDEENGKTWTPTAMVKPDDKNYNTIFGFGYAKFVHCSDNIMQELEVYVPINESAKINVLTLTNNAPKKKKIRIIYYIKPVIGEDEIKSDGKISLEYKENNNMIIARKIYNSDELNNVVYISSSEKIKSYTGDKTKFLGDGGLENPDGLKTIRLDNNDALGKKTCIAIELNVEIESFSNKKVSIILGAEENVDIATDVAYRYSNLQNCKTELQNVKNKWNELLGKVKVNTPYESLNIILNGWTMYQTISSRILGKTGFYQSGGAYGFRDQLQDAFSTRYIDSQILYNQILKHSRHQFIEGDVEHWWHDENDRGIRTRFSDDLLWLPYAVIKYINFTGDYEILNKKTTYLQGEELKENENEKYNKYISSNIEESIYEHCKKAIKRACNFGENGLPKIGIGDWNDGFSNIGTEGKGESVWLGFFLYIILKEFSKLIKQCKQEEIETSNWYENIAEKLKENLNENAWDGKWYKRAFADNGDIYGSMENEECKIDSIAQSWSVISGAGDIEKKESAMKSLENHLVDNENGLIKLLDPAFDKSKLEPGYIKSYIPGVRENGGQYTHAAVWSIIAEAILGDGNKAVEWYKMINPIEHSRTKKEANRYKVEPYVMPADIYGNQNLLGQGGWTWYTGSSGWYYTAGIEYILGLKIYHNVLSINPCIQKEWDGYSIQFKYKESIYNINVKNISKVCTGVKMVELNGIEIENKILLDGSGKIFNVEVKM